MALQGYSWLNPFGNRESRMKRRADNNLGIVSLSSAQALYDSPRYRKACLEQQDAYYERRQYAHLPKWDDPRRGDEFVPVRQRAPRINYNFAKTLSARVTSRLVGLDTFPKFAVPDDPDTELYLRLIGVASNLQAHLLEATRRMLNNGSGFVRFKIEEGRFVLEHYLSKYCYPIFTPWGDLESISIRRVYEDKEDLDDRGQPKLKWWRMDLGQQEDVLFDNPDYDPEQKREDVIFQPMETAPHELGFVQGEWLRTVPSNTEPDGYSLISEILDFIDEINYVLSQSSQAVSYNADPQLVISGMSDDEVEGLIRSAKKGWNLGREGKAALLESNLSSVQRAMELGDKMRLGISDIARVVFQDPEKINAEALSGKAMEIMNAPLVELINELRPVVGPNLKNLVLKMGAANLIVQQQGMAAPVTVRAGWAPKSYDAEINWPPVFQNTMVDLKEKLNVATLASTGSFISRETLTRWLAKDFNIEDVEAELQRIAAQPVLNPFGAF